MTTYTKLKVMADWQCWPVWTVRDDGGTENPDPRDLGLSADLAERLVAWSDRYDARIDEDDFSAPLFDDPAESAAFAEEGLAMAREVARQVGNRFGTVEYSYPEDARIVVVG